MIPTRPARETIPDIIEQMRVDLLNAGWVEERLTRWRAPNGELFIGPAGAWRHMQAARLADNLRKGRAR